MRALPLVVPGVGVEPTSPYGTADFKSAAFAISPPRHRYDSTRFTCHVPQQLTAI